MNIKIENINDINQLRFELRLAIQKECIKLWRLKRTMETKNCSRESIQEVEREAWDLYHNFTAYPERLLNSLFEYKYKYAFR